ncbi:hypothetical protein P691DRAFT_761585 [Macrolepiota fuliginosa MF-IS2]|uniref:F-box domain-containing protein n=1 Tax=Macrolepiota fuliginosa MF-IS2 TaxID=1400762 RepID=A0A9P6C2A9_9AGAR|nr:hypothetical protein P691DRAFT_761585 [Macrolepiota fuliginosa MF-IS2]
MPQDAGVNAGYRELRASDCNVCLGLFVTRHDSMNLCLAFLSTYRSVFSWCIDIQPKNLFWGFYKLAAAALKRTTNIIALDIAGLDQLLALLAYTPFPKLIEVKIPYTPLLTTFLNTHRHMLRAVVLQGPPTPSNFERSSVRFQKVEMPELMAFVGPCNVIPFVLPGSRVRYLTVCWDEACQRPEELMRFVTESRSEIMGMDNLVLGWSPTLLGVIGEFVPKVETLRIRNVCSIATKEMIDMYLVFLEEGLKKFEHLHTLAITLLFNPIAYRLADLDEEYQTVQRWGAIMPSLTVCTLPSTTRWTRFKDNHWFPIGDLRIDPSRSIKMRWFFRAFINGTYPSEMFPEISGGVELDAFEDMIPGELLLTDEDEEEYEEVDEEDEDENENDEEDGTDWNESSGEGDSGWDSSENEDDIEWESG